MRASQIGDACVTAVTIGSLTDGGVVIDVIDVELETESKAPVSYVTAPQKATRATMISKSR